MYVYFIEAIGQNLIKIGRANNPRERHKRLSTGNPYKLKILNVIKYDETEENLERKMHKLFEEFRSNGEWFELSSVELMEILEENGYMDSLEEAPYVQLSDLEKVWACSVCEKIFKFECLLYRHCGRNKRCRELMVKNEEIEKLTQSLEKRKKKYSQLKKIVIDCTTENKELRQKIADISKENIELKTRYNTVENIIKITK